MFVMYQGMPGPENIKTRHNPYDKGTIYCGRQTDKLL